MTANSVGYDSLVELLTILKSSVPESKRTIKLDTPDKWSASSELKKTPEEKAVFQRIESEEAWKLKNVDGKLIITLNSLGVSQFIIGIAKAKNGEYDFSIAGAKGQNLWFW
ncbi:hypothetical protein [Teredinibacter turnerae]|uniref:hypothetical protein n=1 Tax=Teredinibacter turnerae TaxID=2426 RepID=UPI00039EEE29|nr:hypothetical protein [Teredinibacter turnerae]